MNGLFSAASLTSLSLSIVLGTAFGAGVWLLLALTPRWGTPALARRIAPYVRDVADPRGIWTATPPAFGAMIARIMSSAAERTTALLGGAEVVSRRLVQAGIPGGVERFRSRQLLWGVAGVIVGGAVVVVLAVTGRFTPASAVVPPLSGLIGFVLCDAQLQAAARRRTARLEEELPAVLEFLSLCLAAGEGILDSLRRVSAIGSGELTGELRMAVIDVGTGSSLSEALGAMQRRLDIAPLTRAVDQLVAAIDRGAPLAHVLQAQANDAREDAKRGLIERAGRAEILMMIPLVFLILPLSVLFAIYPGIFMLRIGLG